MSSSLDPPTLASTSSSSSLIDGLDDDNSDKHAPSFTTDPGLVGLNGHGLQQLQLQQLVFSEQSNRHNAAANSAIKLSSVPAAPEMNDTESCSTTSTVTEASTPQRPAAAALSQPQNISPNPAQIPIQIQFRSHTIAPSPPLPRTSPEPTAESVSTAPHNNPSEVTPGIHHHTLSHNTTPGGPLGGSNLRIQTEFHPATPRTSSPEPRHAFATPTPTKRPALSLQPKTSSSSLRPISRTPSLKTPNFGNPFGSASAASSTVPSPVISAMGDVTPLPSPLLSNDSPGPWRKLGRRISREGNPFSPVSAEGDPHASTPTPMAQNKRKTYAGLSVGNGVLEGGAEQLDGASSQVSAHTRNRSISEYIPDPMLIPKRMSTVSGPRIPRVDLKNVKAGLEVQGHMRREPHLSEARGLTPIEKPPTPPPSESSLSANESSAIGSGSSTSSIQPAPEYFEAHGRRDNKRRRWRAIKQLGQGTFSRVMLATSQVSPSSSMLLSDDEDCSPGTTGGPRSLDPVTRYERRTLVAVKVCEHGPRGGASEDRIEMSLKRELEIMQSIHHPCLVHLKAWNIEMTRAILVLSYCPGGDLFDVASQHRDVLSPGLLRRMFAELIGAVGYLHELKIVHRDIKLENVLVNLPPAELLTETDWTTYPYSVITLTDLGLSRRIADDEKLETRCGSDDYAAPEVIMGQPYDGRATDAWSLGVLLYALLEGRLPFDPHPDVGDHAMQMRMRSRTSHRIARVEWRWIEYGPRDSTQEGEGDHEADLARFDAKGLRGAMEVVEGLLKRSRTRWPLTKVAETEWVSGGINVEGGIKFREEEEGEEVL